MAAEPKVNNINNSLSTSTAIQYESHGERDGIEGLEGEGAECGGFCGGLNLVGYGGMGCCGMGGTWGGDFVPCSRTSQSGDQSE